MSDGGIQDTPTQFAARDTAALSKGVVIDERYEILSFVGSGGMCSVYRARHLQLDKTVAIKVLAAPVSSNPDAAKRFQREAQAVSALKHKNIVEAYGFGTFDDHCYMAIEFLEGESLADRLRREGTLDRESFVRIVSQICEGMDFAHSKGIVHRDLKPSNIMIVDDDQVKVVDFGIAKIDTANGDWQKLTQTGKILGTLLYISPEQCQGMGADARSDIYSLGCLMYELLEGSPPFSAESQFALIYQHMEALPEGKQLGEFEGVIHACLQKNPNDRPQ